MQIQCEWCGSYFDDSFPVCPNCGGANAHMKRTGDGVPRTIGELQGWAAKHNIPIRQMRTYIGEDYRGAKAFGIYQDPGSGNFVVYKNKADGTRAVRYQGPDEAYAVNELYVKIKERVAEQKAAQVRGSAPRRGVIGDAPYGRKIRNKKRGRGPFAGALRIIVFVFLLQLLVRAASTGIWAYTQHMADKVPEKGYYYYDDHVYYWQDAWYGYLDGGWCLYDGDLDDLYDHHRDYRSYSPEAYGAESFEDSDCYRAPSYSSDNDWDNDWDNDYDWDDGYDWDDSYDDWDSDW